MMADNEFRRRLNNASNGGDIETLSKNDHESSSSQPTTRFTLSSRSRSSKFGLYVIAITAVVIFFSSDIHVDMEKNVSWFPMMQTHTMLQNVSTTDEIESTLKREHIRVHGDKIEENAKLRLRSLAETYSLTYKIIHELQKQYIDVTLTFGSHLGALRHHGVIPFEEKDVDLAVFSTNVKKIRRAIHTAIGTKPHLNLTFIETDFGFQIPATKELHTYIDVWMFKISAGQKYTTCVGHQLRSKSCLKWYRDFHNKNPPVYLYNSWFPFRTEHFGTERVPIPATNKPIESFHFDDKGPNFWNITCGPDRRWNETAERWVKVNMKERKCSDKYETYPFVFLNEKGIEQLRQGYVVLHELPGVSKEKD